MHILSKDMKNIGRLKKRSDFLRVQQSGRRWTAKGMTLQIADQTEQKSRFGVTVTKRLEKSAVRRNRMKRRLKAVAYDVLKDIDHKNDYVLIGRVETATRDYEDLKRDLKWCLQKLQN